MQVPHLPRNGQKAGVFVHEGCHNKVPQTGQGGGGGMAYTTEICVLTSSRH